MNEGKILKNISALLFQGRYKNSNSGEEGFNSTFFAKKIINEGKLLRPCNQCCQALLCYSFNRDALNSSVVGFGIGLLSFALNLCWRYMFANRLDPSSPYSRLNTLAFSLVSHHQASDRIISPSTVQIIP